MIASRAGAASPNGPARRWRGMLDQAKPKPEAKFVVFHCFDNIERRLAGDVLYYGSIDLIDARHPQTILAYGMNDAAAAGRQWRAAAAAGGAAARLQDEQIYQVDRTGLQLCRRSRAARAGIGKIGAMIGMGGFEGSWFRALRVLSGGFRNPLPRSLPQGGGCRLEPWCGWAMRVAAGRRHARQNPELSCYFRGFPPHRGHRHRRMDQFGRWRHEFGDGLLFLST